jgi:hypothetical protein
MKLKFLNTALVCLILSASCVLNSANATLINFDSLANRTTGNNEILGDEYSLSGIEFSTSGIA